MTMFNLEDLSKVDTMIRAINHPVRLRILELLIEQQNQKTKELNEKIQMNDTILSQHLGILTKAGVIDNEKWKYSINQQSFDAVQQLCDYAAAKDIKRTHY